MLFIKKKSSKCTNYYIKTKCFVKISQSYKQLKEMVFFQNALALKDFKISKHQLPCLTLFDLFYNFGK